MIVVTVARRPVSAPTVAQNVLLHECGPVNIDQTRIAPVAGETVGPGSYSDPNNRVGAVGATAFVSQRDAGKMAEAQAASVERANRLGRWPSNVLLSQAGAADMDDQSGVQKSGIAVNRNRPPGTMTSWLGTRASQVGEDVGFGDVGGASRYFKQVGVKS